MNKYLQGVKLPSNFTNQAKPYTLKNLHEDEREMNYQRAEQAQDAIQALYSKQSAASFPEPRSQTVNAVDIMPEYKPVDQSGDSKKFKPASSNYDVLDEMY